MAPNLRHWAPANAGQATKEPDNEVQRLKSIAEYRQRLADLEDWRNDDMSAVDAGANPRLFLDHELRK